MGGITRKVEQNNGDHSEGIRILNEAFELGIRHFDTAQFYSDGLANELLQKSFSSRRTDVFIASKVGARPIPGMPPMTAAQKPHELRETIETNLETLQTDYLDMVYLRRMDFQPSLIAEGDQQVDLHAQLEELLKLHKEGKILSVGLSHVTLEQVQQAEKEIGIDSVSNIYTLLRRDDEPILDFAQAHNIAWAPYFPLGGASYADIPRITEHASVQRIAEELGATANQVGIKWQLEHSPNTLLITGTSSLPHLKENVAAASLNFTSKQFEELEKLA